MAMFISGSATSTGSLARLRIIGTAAGGHPVGGVGAVLTVDNQAGTTAGSHQHAAINVYNSTGVNNYSQIVFGYNNPAGSLNYAPAYIGYLNSSGTGYGSGSLVFGTRNATNDSAPTERMRILANGNVGIGIATPFSGHEGTNKVLHLHDGTSSSTTSNIGDSPILLLQSRAASVGNRFGINFRMHDGQDYGMAEIGAVMENAGNQESGGIYFATKTDVLATSRPTEHMRIDDSGNVGIGTASPTHKLSVVNSGGGTDMNIGTYAAGKTVGVLYTSADTSGYFAIQSYLSQGSTFGNIILNAQGGNVGIGTTAPDSALDIHGGSIHIHTDGTNELGFGGTNHVEEWIFQYDGGGQGDLSLQSYSDAWYNVMFWDRSNQRVGIGTTSPGQIFHISGSGNLKSTIESAGSSAGVQIKSAGEDYNSSLEFLSAGSSNGQIYYDHHATAGSQKMIFQVGDGAVNAMAIDGAGKVGIGTTSPNYALSVHTADAGGSWIQVTDSDTGTGGSDGFFLGVNGDEAAALYNAEATDMIFSTSATARMTILAAGNVGIGDTTPSYKLEVDGTTRFSGISKFGVNIRFEGGGNASDPLLTTAGDTNTGIYFPGSGKVGVGGTGGLEVENGITATAGTFTDNVTISGRLRSDGGYGINNYWNTKHFTLDFTNGLSNRAFDLEFGNNYFNGWIEVIITASYSNQNSVGLIHKRWYYGLNINGTVWQTPVGRIVESFGPISSQITIMDPVWDGTNTKYKLPIVHTVSTGNSYSVIVKKHSISYAFIDNVTLSSIYDYGSSPANQYPDFYAGTTKYLSTDSSGNATFAGRVDGTITGFYLKEGSSNAFSIKSNGANGYLLFRDEYNSADRLKIEQSGQITIPGHIAASSTATFTGAVTIDHSGTNSAVLIIDNDTAGKSAIHFKDAGTSKGMVGLTGAITGNSTTDIGLFSEAGSGVGLFVNGSGTRVVDINSSGNATFTGTIGSGAITSTGNIISTGANASISGSSTSTGSFGMLMAGGPSSAGGNGILNLDTAQADKRVISILSPGTTTENTIIVDSAAVTTGNVLNITDTNSLTTGKIARFHSNSGDDSTRNLVEIINDHASSPGTTALYVQQDGTGPAITTTGTGYAISGSSTSTGSFGAISVGLDYADNYQGNKSIYTKGHIDINGSGGLSFNDNTSTGFFYNGSAIKVSSGNNIGFWTYPGSGGYLERMRIIQNGSVGIGVTSPANLLQVGDHVHVTSAGLVGIGLAAPETDLHIAAASPAVRFTDENVSNLKHQIIGGGDAGLEYSADFNNVAAGYHRWDISASEKMRLTEAGNLGIGVTTPVTALDVHSAGNEVAAVFGMADDGVTWVSTRTAETQNNYGAYAFMVGSAAIDGVSSANTTAYISSNVKNNGGALQGDLGFYTNAGDSLSTAKITILAAGNVGINDTTPSYKLDVNGTGRFTGNLRTDGEFTLGGNSVAKMNGSVVEIGNPDGNSVTTKIHGFDGSGYLLVGENLITADDASILGISGTANAPAFQLGSANDGFFHSGGISVQVNNVTEFLLADGGIFHADGDIIAYSTSTASDIRLKTNIQPISGSLNKLEQLRPVEFDWLVDRDRHEYGLIAQEVEKVLPEIVVENKAIGDTKKFLNDLDGTEDFKTVDYSKLNVLLIDAIKEQQKQIEELKKEIKEIKNGSAN